MSFFSSITHKKPALGIDFGTASIKVAEVIATDKGFLLKNYALLENTSYLERANDAIQTSNLKISEEKTAAYLRTIFERVRFSTKDVVLSVPPFLAFSTLLELPVASDAEVKKVIDLQARQYIPLPLSAVTIDWMQVGERKDGSGKTKAQVMLVAIPNEQITAYGNICKLAGLHLRSVEIEGMSLARALSQGVEQSALVVDIGARSTGLSIVRNGFLYFNGQTDFSGASLTQTIAKGLSISPRRAEDLKRARGIGSGGEHELSTLIEPLLDVIISEGKRVIASYESSHQDKVASIVIAGGGASLLGIEAYFSKYFGLPTSKADPFTQVAVPSGLEAIKQHTGPALATAIGLGLKELI